MAVRQVSDVLASLRTFAHPYEVPEHLLREFAHMRKNLIGPPSTAYPRSHLLSLPAELLEQIWEYLLQDSARKKRHLWHAKHAQLFAGVSLSCRQLYHSVRNFGSDRYTTPSLFPSFVGHVADKIHINRINVTKIRSICIEFQQDSGPMHFFMLKRLLQHTRYLNDLSLYFTGNDKFGTPILSWDCGLAPAGRKEHNLPLEGQRLNEFGTILFAIRELPVLQKLVLSNMNFPILPGMFSNKSMLRYIHLTADPRSASHRMFPDLLEFLPLINPPRDRLNSVEVMHIDVNATLNASQLVLASARSLKHLTWRVPDVKLGSNLTPRHDDLGHHWWTHTAYVISSLQSQATKLTTLRICIGGARHPRDSPTYGELTWALTHGIQGLTTLRHLEVHTNEKLLSCRPNILDSIPPTLTRFYTNDLVTPPEMLYDHVTQKYFRSKFHPYCKYLDEPVRQWGLSEPHHQLKHDLCPEFGPSEEAWIWLQPTRQGFLSSYNDNSYFDYKVTRHTGRPYDDALHLPGIIGEDMARADYIPMRNGDLGFIAYEFTNPDHVLPTGETVTQMILRINGRLLDRERNMHLTLHGHTRNIPIYKLPDTASDSGVDAFEDLGAKEITRLAEALEELGNFEWSDKYDGYFGTEDEAVRVFLREPSASPSRVERYSSVVVREGARDDCCRWLCPEADVPALAEHVM